MFNEDEENLSTEVRVPTGRDAFRPVLAVLCGRPAIPRQPKTIAATRAEFRTGAHFASGWNFGEEQALACAA